MRHLGSVVLAAVFAPAVLILVGNGYGWFADATTRQPADQVAMMFALAALMLGGLLYALLTLPRLSPLGPVLAGGAYLGLGVWALADLAHLLATVPADLVGLDDAMASTTAAVSPLLAVPLLATGYSARRWRGPAAEAEDRPPLPAYPQPAYQAPPAAPAYQPPPVAYQSPTVAHPYPPLAYPSPALPGPAAAHGSGRPAPYRPPPPTTAVPAISPSDQPTEPIPVLVEPGSTAGNDAPPAPGGAAADRPTSPGSSGPVTPASAERPRSG